MSVTLCVPEELRESVDTFVNAEGLPIDVVSDDSGTVRVVQSGERRKCDPTTLQAGGWIPCTVARAMAAKMRIDSRKMGKLLDLLDIKVRECALGCFE